jgi:hypothetical protein
MDEYVLTLMFTRTRKIKFILPWAVMIIVGLVTLHYTGNALTSAIVPIGAFFLTKVALGFWTTPIDEFYDAIRSGKPERIKAATALRLASESGDKERIRAAIDALAKAIREGK